MLSRDKMDYVNRGMTDTRKLADTTIAELETAVGD